eukprot:CAMPEP_0184861936 /NCGR_PEP_ID=MMETSP0580-20130426/6511_1 /TAXON_ID=1118495 /ORGANISM="Dactyliosolen fragilissimus" /LENGTH=327 /DNA_ID=CAMNT_0027359617 /DNA_START=189 /DNA_END=1172 /DNA_ORIENTATION=-
MTRPRLTTAVAAAPPRKRFRRCCPMGHILKENYVSDRLRLQGLVFSAPTQLSCDGCACKIVNDDNHHHHHGGYVASCDICDYDLCRMCYISHGNSCNTATTPTANHDDSNDAEVEMDTSTEMTTTTSPSMDHLLVSLSKKRPQDCCMYSSSTTTLQRKIEHRCNGRRPAYYYSTSNPNGGRMVTSQNCNNLTSNSIYPNPRVPHSNYPDPSIYGWTYTGCCDHGLTEFFQKEVTLTSPTATQYTRFGEQVIPAATASTSTASSKKEVSVRGLLYLDFYYTTGTVQTLLLHPCTGTITRLFGRGRQLLPEVYIKILQDPLLHTDSLYQ